MLRTLLVVAMIAAVPSLAAAEGDAKKGEKTFRKCKACHTATEDKNKVGPSLMGVFGRKAGTHPDFKYSKGMTEIGVTWDEANLDKFLTKPKDFVKGTKMIFAGLKKEDDRANVIAYLKQQSK